MWHAPIKQRLLATKPDNDDVACNGVLVSQGFEMVNAFYHAMRPHTYMQYLFMKKNVK